MKRLTDHLIVISFDYLSSLVFSSTHVTHEWKAISFIRNE